MEIPPRPSYPWIPVVFLPPPGWRPPPERGEVIRRLALSLFLGVIALPILILFLSVDTPRFESLTWAVGATLVLSGIAVGSVARRRHPAGRRGAMLITTCACVGSWAVLYGLYTIATLLQLDIISWSLPFVLALPVAAFAAFSVGSIGIEWRETWALALGCGLAAEVGMYLALWLAIVLLSSLVVLVGGGADSRSLLFVAGSIIVIATIVGCFLALAAAVLFIGGGLLGGYLRVAFERRAISSLPSAAPLAAWSAPGTEDQRSRAV